MMFFGRRGSIGEGFQNKGTDPGTASGDEAQSQDRPEGGQWMIVTPGGRQQRPGAPILRGEGGRRAGRSNPYDDGDARNGAEATNPSHRASQDQSQDENRDRSHHDKRMRFSYFYSPLYLFTEMGGKGFGLVRQGILTGTNPLLSPPFSIYENGGGKKRGY
jgi:hypothetical protein